MSSKKGLSGAAGEKRRRSGASPSPFDEMASEYDSWFDGDGRLIFAIEVKAFQKLLPALPKPWVEIGVGSGRFARALGIETGIDPSLELVKMARQRGINAIQGRGEQAPFDKGSFGTVFLIVTLCFLDSPRDVLRETKNMLAPGGKLVLGLVLKESPWGRFYRRKKDEGHRFYKFAHFYSREEVSGLLERAGFAIEDIIATLFQRPNEVHDTEEPRQGYSPEAGFTIIVAGENA
jgi:SAM-dependent methyltransferase